MTDKKIKDLSRKYVEEVYNGDTDFIDEALSIIGWLLLDHCIVSREKVISEIKAAQKELNEPSKPKLKFTLGYVLGLLHNIFGTELFEERSVKSPTNN